MAVRKAECDMGLGRNCISGIFVIVSRKRFEVNPFVGDRIPFSYISIRRNPPKPPETQRMGAVTLPVRDCPPEGHPVRTRCEPRSSDWNHAGR